MGKIIHVLLTYRCSFKCDHCFVYASPQARGTFTYADVSRLLEDIARVDNIDWVVFDGGEPFLRYSLLLQSIHKARNLGLEVGVITNGFFARNEAAARRFLEPLHKMGVKRLCVSDDGYHYKTREDNSAKRALRVGASLGIPVQRVDLQSESENIQGLPETSEPLIDESLKYIGRSTQNLDFERRFDASALAACRVPSLEDPRRLLIDAHGNVQVCQGLSIGNARETPLHELLASYNSAEHPIIAPLRLGGPRRLAQEFGYQPVAKFVDPCQLCYSVRKEQLEAFPQYLAPRQVYGL